MANKFEAEVAYSAKVLGIHYDKKAIPTKFVRGRFILLKENNYDSFIVHKGRHIALELKSQEIHGTFPLGNIQDHQYTGLQEMITLGCPAYFLINMRRKDVGKTKTACNKAWGIHFADWMDLLLALPEWRGKPRHSIPRDFFDDKRFFFEIPRIHALDKAKAKNVLVWDLRVLIK